MELEKGAYPPKGDAPGLAATSPQDIENPSAPPEAGALGETAVKAGLERASIYVKGAVEKTRERIAAYREGGIEQVSQNILEYTRSQPKTALLIAASVGIFIGVLVAKLVRRRQKGR